MKTILEHFTYFLLIAPLAPLAGFLGGWWLAYYLLPENFILTSMLSALLLGLLVDGLILKKLVNRAHTLGGIFWTAVILFYAIGLFGFSMGVPLLNVGLALPVGFLAGSHLAHLPDSKFRFKTTAKKVSLYNTGLLFLTCAGSAFFALASPSTPADLQGMLALPFIVTLPMIWGVILLGGSLLLVINYFLTLLSFHFTYRFLSTP